MIDARLAEAACCFAVAAAALTLAGAPGLLWLLWECIGRGPKR